MSEYYDGAADHATYDGHDAYQGEEHGGQYADYQEQVHHVIELIGEKIDGIEHDAREAYEGYQAENHQAEEHQAEEHQAEEHQADEYQTDYVRS
ncbi:hypothetical protein Daura_07275 [Dactylosporangium aurantiacum]|uniref:Uncharacterized protein n=1 Tax=Dactylosporangium aurantiacum TaxID=35754 RepID=A0A9Q9II15_9ACTN|nr:hypothetical protein [Dactylosporangium aurantiacum]MDG6105963.1 hypothetical protein [Dactylosporangium aurantiacum]UWZ55986.1 hypothetical protein Daura_07275 [Dactylosporangium aurantiacum]